MNHMPVYFPEIYNVFGINSNIAQFAMQILVFISIIVLISRVVICAGYKSVYVIYKSQAKEIKTKGDATKIKYGFFSKVVKAYTPILEKSVNYISSKDIIEREFEKTGIFFINFKSLDYMITVFENSMLLIGIILSLVFAENDAKISMALGTIILFVAIKLWAMIFDYQMIKEKTVLEMSMYIDTEIGQFYAKDTLSSINLLRIEIKKAMLEQSNSFGNSIDKFCVDLSEVVKKLLVAMSDKVEDTMHEVLLSTEALNTPLENWKEVINDATKNQEDFNKTIIELNNTMQNIEKITTVVDGGFNKMSEKMAGYFSEMSTQTLQLIDLTKALKDRNNNYIAQNKGIEQQIGYIKKNQQSLEVSLQQYELTLKEITSRIGTDMGKIIEFHTQDAYNTMNENLQENLKVILNSNNELINQLKNLFQQMQEQSKSEANAILSIKEQMESENR